MADKDNQETPMPDLAQDTGVTESTAAPEVTTPVESATPQAAAPAVVANPIVKVTKHPHFKKFGRLALELILLIAVIGLTVWGLGLQSKNSDLQKEVDSLNANPAIVEQRKTADLIAKVARLIDVPANETPQAALVSDSAALKKQYPFFTDVQNGDQILFYVKAGKVIVYRPATDKVIQTGPLNINQDTKKKED